MKKLLLITGIFSSVALAEAPTVEDLTNTEKRLSDQIQTLRTSESKIERLRRKIGRRNRLIGGLFAGCVTLAYLKLFEKKANGITNFEQLRTDLAIAQATLIEWWNEDEQDTYRAVRPVTQTTSTTEEPKIIVIEQLSHDNALSPQDTLNSESSEQQLPEAPKE